jgi:hypothetical protein
MTTEAKLPPPTPLAGRGEPVDWMFAFKFNSATSLGSLEDVTTPGQGDILRGQQQGALRERLPAPERGDGADEIGAP